MGNMDVVKAESSKPGFLSPMLHDKEFTRNALLIAVPICIQQLATSSLNFVDMIMIGHLGEKVIASVGLSNNFFFIFMCLLNGISAGASIFAAQFWGKKDVSRISAVLGFSLLLCISVGLFFSIVTIFFPATVLSIYTNDAEVIQSGQIYLRMIGFSLIATSITFCYSAVLRSIGNAKVPMYVSVCALSLNTLLNYCLIFGNFGFPVLGLKGTAIATLTARIVECISIVAMSYVMKTPLAYKRIQFFFSYNLSFVKQYFKTTSMLIVGITFWALGLNFYNKVYAHIGTHAIAAYSVAGTVEQIAFVVFTGLSGAANVLIGNKIGAEEEARATVYAKRFLVLGVMLALVVGLMIFALSHSIVSLYDLSSEASLSAKRILLFMGGFLWLKVINMILIQGVLNAGGDTRFTLIQNVTSMWAVGIPMAFLSAYLLHLPIYWVFLFIMLEELAKLLIGLPRFISRRWMHNLTGSISSPNHEAGEKA